MESYKLHSEFDSESLGRRKGRKLLAEKRRRARINQCLADIKDIVCGSRKHNDPNYEKLEKAEILESTVDYLRNVRKINTTPQQVKETVQVRFQQGFSRCAEEILSYIQSLPGASDKVHHQLRKHLSGRLTHIQQGPVTSSPRHVAPLMTQCHERLQPADQNTSTHVHMNLSVCTSPALKHNSLEDSGYIGSPDSVKYSKDVLLSDSVSDSELYRKDFKIPTQNSKDSRVNAWVESTLSFSQQIEMEQQAPWRPW